VFTHFRFKKRSSAIILLVSISLVFALNSKAQSEEVPLWLLDGSIAAISLDAYPGSSFQRTVVFPFPNFRLNSPYLQSSGGGVNARLFNSDKFDLGMTFGASIPTKTKHLDARKDRDMPDLDPTLEVGLGLRYIPFKTNAWELKSQFPLRKATGIAYQDQDELWKMHKPLDLGWTFSPRVTLTHFIQRGDVKHEIDFEVGSKLATQQNMNFFYGVEDQFTINGEDPFVAEEGLMNNWVELGWVRKRDKWRFSISAEYVDLHDAENKLSPLVEETDSWFGFIILTYTFAQSELMVEQDSEFSN
jgi:outer membrane scaffolding protein for murein synthesis (MipA/OmpV family)